VFEHYTIPDGKMLMPGVVSHATDLVENPELVAQRLVRYANLIGRENLVAGSDCGLSRVHHEICWAKLRALRDGAQIASRRLWKNTPT
jgi:5-methyltetrahydropteroyltriglutamate--homocysteine methyltransferase